MNRKVQIVPTTFSNFPRTTVKVDGSFVFHTNENPVDLLIQLKLLLDRLKVPGIEIETDFSMKDLDELRKALENENG